MPSVVDKDEELGGIVSVRAALAEGAVSPDPVDVRTVQRAGATLGGARFQESLRNFANARGFDALLVRLQVRGAEGLSC